jgi:putative ABC transport system permease protein
MFKNYLMTTLRHLVKHKMHSILTILGLAVGFAASAIIIIINYTEMNYDRHWADSDRIYKLESTSNSNNENNKNTFVYSELYDIIKNNIPDVEYIARKQDLETKIKHTTTENPNKEEYQEGISIVDSSFFKIFNCAITQGALQDFYADESSIVITEALAEKLFGKQSPIGKLVNIETTNFDSHGVMTSGSNVKTETYKDYKVAAIIGKNSHKSSISFPNIFVHLQNNKHEETKKDGEYTTIFNFSYQIYLKTKSRADIAAIERSFPDAQNRFTTLSANYGKKPSDIYRINFLNIKDVHLKGAQVTGQIEKIWMLFGLAAIILLMACINYINLALAAYSRRQKEIALRKTLGASKNNILRQFLSESVLIASIALLVSLMLIELCMPWLKSAVNLDIERSSIYAPQILGYLLVMTLVVGLIAGAYPSFYLSRFNPATTLKSNKSIESPRSIKFRQVLVISQFVISGIMLTCVSIIAAQMHKVQAFDPGYQTKNIIFAIHSSLGTANQGSIQHLKYQISKIPGVQTVALAIPSIPGKNSSAMQVSRQGDSANKIIMLKQVMLAGPDDLQVFNIKLIAGKYFSAPINAEEAHPAMQDKIYINQQALAPLDFKTASEAINQKIDVVYNSNYKMPMTIVGVTPAVHIGSFNTSDQPGFFWPLSSTGMHIAFAIRYESGDRKAIEEKIKTIWKESLGYMPVTWFIEGAIADEYKNENLIARFVYIFTGIAIFISCLGLYGLASHAASKRKKEISLRKVNGASVFNIVTLLLWQFSKPVLFANIIIWPIALYATSRWLEQFVNRIDIWQWGPVFCLSSAALAILIAWLTVGGQAFIVAREKPVEALREE